MNRWLTSNLSLKLIALFLAIGMVWIKGQEKINHRSLTGVPVTVENLPSNIYLADPWIPPTVSVLLQGPRNALDLIRPDQSSFRIDLSKFSLPDVGSPLNVILTDEMFRTNLDPRDRLHVSVLEETVRPGPVTILISQWNVDERQSEPPQSESGKIIIPLYQVQKEVPIVVPRKGSPPKGLKVVDLKVDPESLLMTGERAALSNIQSVSTTMLDLNLVSSNPPPFFLPLQTMNKDFDIRPLRETIRGVTVTLKLGK